MNQLVTYALDMALKMKEQGQELAVDEADTAFIKDICRELPGTLRAHWNPAPVRGQPQAKPTSVRLVADDLSFVGYAIYQLAKMRAQQNATHEMLREAGQEAASE